MSAARFCLCSTDLFDVRAWMETRKRAAVEFRLLVSYIVMKSAEEMLRTVASCLRTIGSGNPR